MIDKFIAASVTVGAPAAVAATTSATESPVAMIAGVAVACLAATIARAVAVFDPTSKKNKVWVYEIAVVLFCVLIAGSLAWEHSWTIGQSATYGGGIGFIGASLKSILANVTRAKIGAIFSAIGANVAKDDSAGKA